MKPVGLYVKCKFPWQTCGISFESCGITCDTAHKTHVKTKLKSPHVLRMSPHVSTCCIMCRHVCPQGRGFNLKMHSGIQRLTFTLHLISCFKDSNWWPLGDNGASIEIYQVHSGWLLQWISLLHALLFPLRALNPTHDLYHSLHSLICCHRALNVLESSLQY